MSIKKWDINENEAKAILQALKAAGVQNISLDYSDLENSVTAIENINIYEDSDIDPIASINHVKVALKELLQAHNRTEIILKKVLKALALTYLELERRTRTGRTS